MNKKLHILLFVSIGLFALACATLSGGGSNPDVSNPVNSQSTKLPTSEISATETPAQPLGIVIYQDDFSSDTRKLETFQGENGIIGVSNGAYSIQNFADKWMWGRISVEASNSYIEVDATQVSGPTDNNTGYGVLCRLTHNANDGLSGYIFAVSGDGFASINLIKNNKFTALVDWTSISGVNQGNSRNHLRASCIGDKLALEINRDSALEATDSTFSTGDFGFAGISFNVTFRTMQVEFDNLSISQP